jgi:hypothetical protein
MDNLKITGIYTYFYRCYKGILYMKVGKGKNIQNRITGHMTSCAALTIGLYWRTSRNSLHDSETKIKELLGKRYERIRDETFLIHDSMEEVNQYLKEHFNPDAISGLNVKKSKVNYGVTTLFGDVEDIRDHRPSSYFHPSKQAAPTTEVGPDEDWRKTWTCISRSGKLLDEPVIAYHDQQTWNAIRGERRYQRYLKNELKKKESLLQQFMTA